MYYKSWKEEDEAKRIVLVSIGDDLKFSWGKV